MTLSMMVWIRKRVSRPRDEAEERFDKAVNAWKNACLPLKLAIEIITNLCADAISVMRCCQKMRKKVQSY